MDPQIDFNHAHKVQNNILSGHLFITPLYQNSQTGEMSVWRSGTSNYLDYSLGIELYFFVFHRVMKDRGSRVNFRHSQSEFRKFTRDPLSFVTR